MPSLMKFLGAILFLALVVLGSMVALVVFVEPATREMSVTIPREKFEQSE